MTYFAKIPLERVVSYIFIGMGMFVLFVLFVLFVEFFKSGDVSPTIFIVDQIFAIAAVITATVLLTFLYLVVGETPNYFYWFSFAVILGDAILSPFNAFRMALRNFGVSGQ